MTTLREFFDGVTAVWDRDGEQGRLRNRADEMIATAALIQHLRDSGIYAVQLSPKVADVRTSMFIPYADQPKVLVDQSYDLTIMLFDAYATHKEDLADVSPKHVLFWETLTMMQLLDLFCEAHTDIPEYCAQIKQDHKLLEDFIYD